MARHLSRRRALELGAAIATGTVTGALGRPMPVRAAAARAGGSLERATLAPVSMAMHIHGSFSEGTASMDAHLDQAQRSGVDVLWWTDHDFRIQAHGYRQAVRFDAMSEPELGVDWTWVASQGGPVVSPSGTFVAEPHTPDESGKALRLAVTGPADGWGRFSYEGVAANSTYSTSLADTTLELDVLAVTLGSDAELLVEISSSYRPATAGRPAGQYTLQYRIGSAAGRFTEQAGLLGVVASPAGEGWQRLTLRPVEDIAVLWPDLVAGDASLCALRIAVRARRGATATAVVDRLRFLRSRRADQEGLRLQEDLIRAYSSRYPTVRQHHAVELSLVRHLNAFGGQVFLPTYDPGPDKDNSVTAALDMVAQVHAHGGLAAYNHPLEGDVSNRRDLARLLVTTSNLGADILEVGCTQEVEDVTFAYDTAARNGVYVTATGTSDDHSGTDWLGQRYRWVTHAWAKSTGKPQLQDALSRGRIWFGDPAVWQGAMEISAQGQRSMGGVLVTPDAQVPMKVSVSDLPADSTLELITGDVDFAGPDQPEPAVTTIRYPAAEVVNGKVKLDFVPGAGRYLRAVIRGDNGGLIGFSNPTWVFPSTPPAGVPPQRLL